ncbi:hypothetical protein F5884DRAFT_526012 [Xylogone sp. PMI_703]|nr:hypothetical protein F5884DRAFT_526012 [Xylogone sp. PMI_703]
MATPTKITVYSSKASQWASVAHLTLEEKGYQPDEYIVEEIDLVGGENFHPDYVKINPNGTIPSLTAPNLSKPLIESADVLAFLDGQRQDKPSLFPKDAAQRQRVNQLISHVHQDKLSTNLILLQARDEQEMNEKKNAIWKQFLANRQEKLTKYGAQHPEIPLYASRTKDNGAVHELYNTEIGPAHQHFFKATDDAYKGFADGLRELDSLLVLPYAAGESVTAADIHIVPWLAHGLWGAGGSNIFDFEPLEKLIQKSDPNFTFGDRTKTWWKNISETQSFKKVFPALH